MLNVIKCATICAKLNIYYIFIILHKMEDTALSADFIVLLHPTLNQNIQFPIHKGSNTKYWWYCRKYIQGDVNYIDHIYFTTVKNKVVAGLDGCSCCSGKQVVPSISLAMVNPDIALQWHPTKNEILTPLNVSSGSKKKVWWKCPVADDHEWEASICKRTRNNAIENPAGCPFCAGQAVCVSNCLATLRKDIADQWDQEANGELTPFHVTVGANRSVWWKCPVADDHKWNADIASRTGNNRGCPVCDGKLVVPSNSLLTLFPDIAKEWHPTKNGELKPEQVTRCCNKSIWWKCSTNPEHEWQNLVTNRTRRGDKCPICQKRGYSEMAIKWLKYIQENNPTIHIQHAENGREYKIPNTRFRVDGYCEESKTIYEFHGTFWHGHPSYHVADEPHPGIKNITFGEKYKQTIDREDFLRNKGYNVVVMWEHDWRKIDKC